MKGFIAAVVVHVLAAANNFAINSKLYAPAAKTSSC